jgi:hypothetical protein
MCIRSQSQRGLNTGGLRICYPTNRQGVKTLRRGPCVKSQETPRQGEQGVGDMRLR